ncbi:PriCT-2 domain-containing protein [Porphyrobacter sp. CCH7-A1]|uniref:PriCT-2 domain-containing protein n=1 Tax=Porphyrobacter sp. CCH7-A1 TaxID=1768773 RepID=UPI00082E98BC|nr:PriCT-2 domain-containing protein [Porphyrobacter sp. CCH7-A1]
MTHFLADHGDTLADNGYPLIPIKPGDKVPGHWTGSAWINMPKWQMHALEPLSPDTLAAWQAWPDCGIGIPCGQVVGIDIDVMDAALAQRIAELARMKLGDTPALRIGQHPKQMLVYHAPTPFQSFEVKPLQVLALGRQFVAYGIHPDTGKPYHWPTGSLLDCPLDSLPSITEAQARAWLAEAVRLLPSHMRAKPTVERTGGGSSGQHEPSTPEAVRSALAYVSSDCGRDQWIHIGMAIKAGLGEGGCDIWHEWSARDYADYNAKEADAQWRSFRPSGPIGVGTLFAAAQDGGWPGPGPGEFLYAHEKEAASGPPRFDIKSIIATALARQGGVLRSENDGEFAGDLEFEPQEVEQLVRHTVATRLAAPAPAAPPARRSIPQWLADLAPGNPMRGWMEHCMACSPKRLPILALAACLPLFGTLAGRRYAGPTNLRTNIYTIGVGLSGAGKNHALKSIGATFAALNLPKLIGGSEIASGAAIVSTLVKHPSVCFTIDECQFLLKVMNDGDRAAFNQQQILKVLMEAYSSAGLAYFGTAYANQKEKPTEVIFEPCLSFAGATTPDKMWASFSSANARDGSLARFLVFDDPTRGELVRYPGPGMDDMPETLKDAMLAVHAGAEGHDYAPLDMGGDRGANSHNAYRVPYADHAASDLAWTMRVEADNLIYASNPAHASFIARLAENAAKLALLKAVTDCPQRPAITCADLEWGMALARTCLDNLIAGVDKHVADNEYERDSKRVQAIIEDAGAGGITKYHLTRATRSLDTRRRDDILRSLVEAELIRHDSHGTGPARKSVYYAQ